MTTAEDSPADRRAGYRRLFEHALLGRDSTDTTTTFRLADRPGVGDWVLDLVRREAACCPFLAYEVDAVDDQIVWTTTGLGAADMAVLDEFLDGRAPLLETSESIAQRLTELGGFASSCRARGCEPANPSGALEPATPGPTSVPPIPPTAPPGPLRACR